MRMRERPSLSCDLCLAKPVEAERPDGEVGVGGTDRLRIFVPSAGEKAGSLLRWSCGLERLAAILPPTDSSWLDVESVQKELN